MRLFGRHHKVRNIGDAERETYQSGFGQSSESGDVIVLDDGRVLDYDTHAEIAPEFDLTEEQARRLLDAIFDDDHTRAKRKSVQSIMLCPYNFSIEADYTIGGPLAKANCIVSARNSTMPEEVREAVFTVLEWCAEFAYDEAQKSLGLDL